MTRVSSLLSIFACVLALGACSPLNEHFSAAHPQLVAAPDTVSAMLADAADRASKSLETLAAVENARAKTAPEAPGGDAPVELRRVVTVNWTGPVEPILKTMAERAGYSFLPVGLAPPTPVIVALDVENRPVIDVLRDIGSQLGMRGDVKVDSGKKIVELDYPPTTGAGQ